MSSSSSVSARGSVFLLSDYGSSDEFAGVLRAVVVREAPGAPLVDLTHEIPPFDVRAGALALERSVPHLGPGVVLAVVDPGVGTGRRAVAVSVAEMSGPRHFVAPDNGLPTFALEALGEPTSAIVLARGENPTGHGTTFDGRDLFAPAAARLWEEAASTSLELP